MNNLRSHTCCHSYRVYGLTLGANVKIPGLGAEKVDNQTADMEIYMGVFPNEIERLIAYPTSKYYLEPAYKNEDPPHLTINTLSDGKYFHFYYGYGVEFVLDKSATIVWGKWKTPLVMEDATLYLLGPILGFMLRLRGITCLHASGVVVDEKAFALTGPSGAGKSTLAASFAAAGYPVLSDDVLPLTTINGIIHAQSGYSRLRLFPNSFENLPDLPDNLPLLAPGWDKCYLDLASDSYELHKTSRALQVIYIIDWDVDNTPCPSIAPLSGITALPFLAANTYRNELLTPEMRMNEFLFLSQMVSKIKVRKLHPVNDIKAVPQLREMILDDFRKGFSHQVQAMRHTTTSEE